MACERAAAAAAAAAGVADVAARTDAAVAASAGLDVSGVDGSFLTYNKERPVVPGLLISRPEYTSAALAALHY